MKLDSLAAGRTLLLGFGREGRSLERVLRSRHPGAGVRVLCDRRPEPPPVEWRLLESPEEAIAWRPDRVLRSPGVPLVHPAIVDANARGIPVTCTTSCWFAERPDARVVGVTGSKGKSTTAALIAHLLAAGGRTVELGGNIGVAMLDLLEARADWFVVELSSYQLADLRGSLEVGVFTRLFPEHQDWHGGVESYYRDKLRLIDLVDGGRLWFNAGDSLLAGRLDGISGARGVNAPGSAYRVDDDGVRRGGSLVLRKESLPLAGRHNLDNAALALAVVESIAGWQPRAVRTLSSFRPLAHRLERIDSPGAVTWINDSISTTPYATLAALQACEPEPVLIVGGMERGADWRVVADYLSQRPLTALVALPDNGEAIASRLVEARCVAADRVTIAADIATAVSAAAGWRGASGTVLLSPGAPSFPHFRDFEERGSRFADEVRALALRAGSENRSDGA